MFVTNHYHTGAGGGGCCGCIFGLIGCAILFFSPLLCILFFLMMIH